MANIRCGNRVHDQALAKVHHHESVMDVRNCYASPFGLNSAQEQDSADEQGDDGVYEAEMAYERHLEDACYWEHRAAEQWEDSMGVVSFEDAMDAAAR